MSVGNVGAGVGAWRGACACLLDNRTPARFLSGVSTQQLVDIPSLRPRGLVPIPPQVSSLGRSRGLFLQAGKLRRDHEEGDCRCDGSIAATQGREPRAVFRRPRLHRTPIFFSFSYRRISKLVLYVCGMVMIGR